MFNKYPYTDAHELNLDFVLEKLKELDEKVTRFKAEVIEEASEIAYERSKEYIDEHLQEVIDEFEDLKNGFNDLQHGFDLLEGEFSDLAGEFTDLTEEVRSDIAFLQSYIDAQIVAVNARTDAAITANNNFILDTMQTYLSNVKVLNYFTGEYVSIQDMFDYLAMLHLTDSIDYNTMVARAKTYSQLIALNINYTNLAMHGNTLYV